MREQRTKSRLRIRAVTSGSSLFAIKVRLMFSCQEISFECISSPHPHPSLHPIPISHLNRLPFQPCSLANIQNGGANISIFALFKPNDFFLLLIRFSSNLRENAWFVKIIHCMSLQTLPSSLKRLLWLHMGLTVLMLRLNTLILSPQSFWNRLLCLCTWIHPLIVPFKGVNSKLRPNGKLRRSRSDGSLEAVWSVSTLFAVIFVLIYMADRVNPWK